MAWGTGRGHCFPLEDEVFHRQGWLGVQGAGAVGSPRFRLGGTREAKARKTGKCHPRRRRRQNKESTRNRRGKVKFEYWN